MNTPRTKRCFAILCFFCSIAPAAVSSVRAQTGAETAPDSGANQAPQTLAAVEVDGKELFHLRGVRGYPAKRRAREVQERILALAADPEFDVTSLKYVPQELYNEILAGEAPVLRVHDADGEMEGLPRDTMSKIVVERITEGIKDYRRDRTAEYLRNAALRAAIATLLTAAILFVLLTLIRRTSRLLERRYRRRVESLEEISHAIFHADQLLKFFHGLLQLTSALIVLILVSFCLRYVLKLFPWTRAAGYRFLPFITDPLVSTGKAILDYIPKLIFLVILFMAVRYLLRAIRMFFDLLGRKSIALSGFDPEWAQPTFRIVRLVIIAAAVVIAYPYIPGSESEAFKGISIFLGVILSLGSSSIISNIMAGYSMIYRRAFKVGDRVKIQDAVGDVTARRIMVTHLRTPKNEEVIIPNSTIVSSEVVNYSAMARTEGLILHTTVGIGYETPWRQVEAMLMEAARRTEGLLSKPEPFVLQKSLGDFSVTYEINAYCDNPQAMNRLYAQLHRNILDMFNEYGVQIMTPAYEGDPEQPKIVPKDRWHAAPAAPPGPEEKRPRMSSNPDE